FTPIEAPTGEIVDACNQLGLVVDAVDEPGREIGGVNVARVLAVNPHPNADKLTLVDVELGGGATTTVVCGAKNLSPGDVIPYAGSGARLPGGITLERRKIRGVVSDGMLCSARELGLGDDHSGILHLDRDAPLGVDVRELLGLDDVVLDLDVTPNRPDAMSIVGVARDLAAYFNTTLLVPTPPASEVDGDVRGITLAVEAPDRCPRYVARVATVTLGPSPRWMQRRLTLAGMRPISNVVDVTNYVLLELGQPLHAFDLDRLAGRGIVVRLAAGGETMTTLDGVERALQPDDLLICDAQRGPQAIAGIMGGGSSEVTDTTREVLLESAYFDPVGIGRTSKRLGLRTESSARFERGVDPNGVLRAADRAIELLVDVASAERAAGARDEYPVPIEPRRITIRTARVNALLGTELSDDEISEALVPLGIELEGSGATRTAVTPTFRPDLEREVDLVEEVARRVGYNSIARHVPSSGDHAGGLTTRQRDRRLVVDVLVGMGYDEAYTIPLLAPADLARAGLPPEGVELENPLRAEESLLRPSLLPGLLGAAAFNAGHGQNDLALFEVGHVFLPPVGEGPLPDERDRVAILLSGVHRRRPHEPDRPVDAFDAVDVWCELVSALHVADARLEPGEWPSLHPARTAVAYVDGAPIGGLGEVDPDVVARSSLEGPVVAMELELDALLDASRARRTLRRVSRYPASSVDLAFVVDEAVPAGHIRATLGRAAGDLLESVELFDVFRSDAIGAGRKSLTWALRFRAPDRTLTDADVAAVRERCIDAVVRAHQAELRG
ncbi:MAG TPA: phenylalanine--tRNA ligase subunit beta, partial [Acidimicrobiia bacterium]|nr:phenylalanine--tRNA ligase subunit beta [Acidimicrobiia bacterium]